MTNELQVYTLLQYSPADLAGELECQAADYVSDGDITHLENIEKIIYALKSEA